jgi:hypothetical protein
MWQPLMHLCAYETQQDAYAAEHNLGMYLEVQGNGINEVKQDVVGHGHGIFCIVLTCVDVVVGGKG